MSEIRFETSDAADIRFGISPLWETVRSLYAFADPGRHTVHLPWVRWIRSQTEPRGLAAKLEVLHDIARPRAWLPDFLTPPPTGPLVSLAEELATVVSTPHETVVSDLLATTARMPLPRSAASGLDDPEELLVRLTAAIEAWHEFAITPHWPRMLAVLEADIAYRSRQLAEGGIRRLFNTLHPTVRWAGDRLVSDDDWDLDLDLSGRGLPLLPSVFVDRRVLWSIRGDSPPLAVYPARAAALVWETRPPGSHALSAVLGATRARLLILAKAPATTTELARRLDLSPAAVSQHLRALHAAGLVSRSQHGRAVLYLTSEAGYTLLRASSAQGLGARLLQSGSPAQEVGDA